MKFRSDSKELHESQNKKAGCSQPASNQLPLCHLHKLHFKLFRTYSKEA